MAGRTYRTASGRRAKVREPAAPDLPDDLIETSLPEAELDDGVAQVGLAVSDVDLSGRQVAGAELDECRYTTVSFASVQLRRATIRDVEFDRCDLANLLARDSSLIRVAVRGSRMTGVALLASTVRDVAFRDCRMDMASFSGSRFTNVTFTSCRLDQANFGEADLSGVEFEHCDLSAAQMSGATLTGARFSGCDLTGISGVTSLRGAIITSADAVTLARIFAEALGITIEDESSSSDPRLRGGREDRP
ncbi:MAG TPA: pentapeptide repeat-containing protein [Streptosporangiaceae bacterium]|nr:pentapeptide repeat-containing protein [Streptosporangiaceae bacterium]